eukprot:TRINITY_DN2420_c0_g1_i1.p1 TRINITY_DN2420_c0_g1~~TRINITY_DN2420_c0_g1_i1.p1  ORF type:complete len:369 (-),score=10.60 TRINITY_DN2420_c0_g1_i1:125-1231(-)
MLPRDIFESFSFILTMEYFALALISAIQIFRIIWNRHNLLGWQFTFLLLCFIWSVFRICVWIMIPASNYFANFPSWLLFAIYWYGFTIQFATFSLLVLFYVNVVHHDSWKQIRNYVFTAYIALNIIFFIVVTALIVRFSERNYDSAWANKAFTIFSSLMFSIISVILARYGYKVYQLIRTGKTNIPFQPRGTPQKGIVLVTLLILLIFVTRAIFDCIAAFYPKISPDLELGFHWQDLTFFIIFNIFEIVPTSIVLLLFWRIPSTRKTRSGVFRDDETEIVNGPMYRNSYIPLPINEQEDEYDDNPAPQSARLFTPHGSYASGAENIIPYAPQYLAPKGSPYAPYPVSAPRPAKYGQSSSPRTPLIRDS